MSYSIALNLEGRTVVVVGGGRVATRRVDGLLDESCRIHLIAPDATARLRDLAASGAIAWTQRVYATGDIGDAFLVHVATNDASANAQIGEDASAAGALVCRCDDACKGSFITPATVRRGGLLISLTTGGAAPSLTAVLREQIEAAFGPEYDSWVQLFANLREGIQADGKAAVKRIMNDPEVVMSIEAGNIREAETAARRCI